MHELKNYDESVKVRGVGRGWEVMGNEVETQVWPDVESLMSSARSLDEVLRARGSIEDFKQGTDMFAYLKYLSGNKDLGKDIAVKKEE